MFLNCIFNQYYLKGISSKSEFPVLPFSYTLQANFPSKLPRNAKIVRAVALHNSEVESGNL